MFWVKDSERSCVHDLTPWYKAAAKTGCAVSMYNCGLEQFRDYNNHAGAAEWSELSYAVYSPRCAGMHERPLLGAPKQL